jgi:undecaprenyl-diphosphatase
VKQRQRHSPADRLLAWDRALTLLLNRTVNWKAVRTFFTMISKMGNGRFWYLLMLTLPCFHGTYGLRASLHMGFTALAVLMTYRFVKGAAQRPRPGVVHESIWQATAALDEYSFPSGHTMHAVAFTFIAVAWFPGLLIPLSVLTFLIALSRVILGLHYPTDVILGAVFGMVISVVSLCLSGF